MKKFIFGVVTNPFFSGSMIMVIGSNLVNFLNSVYVIIMGRLLGPEKYGELVSLFSVIGLVSIVPLSLGLVVIKFISGSKSSKETKGYIGWFERKVYLVSFVIILVMVLGSFYINSFLKINDNLLIFGISLSLLFTLPSFLNRSILQGLLKFKDVIISLLTESLTRLTLGALLVWAGFSIGGAIGGLVIATFLGWLLTKMFLKDYIDGENEIAPESKEIFFYAIPILVQSVAVTSIYTTDLVLVKHFFSPTEAGLYAALSTMGKIVFFGSAPISAVMFPMVAKKKSLGQNYKRIFIYSLLLTLAVSVFILSLFQFFPDLVIGIIYGSKYIGVAPLLVWFGAFISLFTLASLFINYYLSLGNTKIVYLPLAAAILQIIGIWFYHKTLISVIYVSLGAASLLSLTLFVYCGYESQKNFRNSSRL